MLIAAPAASRRHGFWSVLPAAVFAMAASGLSFAAAFGTPPTGQMAIVFLPTTSELAAWTMVGLAGGQVVGPTAFANVVVAYAPDPEFKARMQARGALFFMPASGLCQSISPKSGSLS